MHGFLSKGEAMPNRAEEIASKAMGAAKAAKATVRGLSGVFRHLAREHGEAAALLLRLEMTSSAKVRADVFPAVMSELKAHEAGERRVVYPAFMGHPDLEKIAREHEGE